MGALASAVVVLASLLHLEPAAMAAAPAGGGPGAGRGGSAARPAYDPVSEREREDSAAFSRRVEEALQWLHAGEQAQAELDFHKALAAYDQVVRKDGDLALAAYARVGRALSLYEVGNRNEAIILLEGMSVELKGYPEVHAALAAALYADRHMAPQAERQFTMATLLDRRYADARYVADERHWPPSLVGSLQAFLALK